MGAYHRKGYKLVGMDGIYQAESEGDIEAARALFVEYAKSLDYQFCFQGFKDELAQLPGNYAPPSGRLLLAEVSGVVAGCAGLQVLGQGRCEIKRLYVRPEFRGRALGRRLAEAILGAARDMGCARVFLETLPSMKSARALYDDLGFTKTDPAASSGEGPTAMALKLSPGPDRDRR